MMFRYRRGVRPGKDTPVAADAAQPTKPGSNDHALGNTKSD